MGGCCNCSRISRSENLTSVENLESPKVRRKTLMYTPFKFSKAFGTGAVTHTENSNLDMTSVFTKQNLCDLVTPGTPKILEDSGAYAAIALAHR
eukprot:643556-Pyramimonas_sp.AAC.1